MLLLKVAKKVWYANIEDFMKKKSFVRKMKLFDMKSMVNAAK